MIIRKGVVIGKRMREMEGGGVIRFWGMVPYYSAYLGLVEYF